MTDTSFDPAGHAERHWAHTVLDELPGCGCGWPEDLYNLWRSTLTTIRDLWGRPGASATKALREAMPDHLHRYLVLACLNRARLLNHGTSIESSWLTVKGARLLEIMEAAPTVEDLEVGLGCSDCPDWDTPGADVPPSVTAVGAFPDPDATWPGYPPPRPLTEVVAETLKALGGTTP